VLRRAFSHDKLTDKIKKCTWNKGCCRTQGSKLWDFGRDTNHQRENIQGQTQQLGLLHLYLASYGRATPHKIRQNSTGGSISAIILLSWWQDCLKLSYLHVPMETHEIASLRQKLTIPLWTSHSTPRRQYVQGIFPGRNLVFHHTLHSPTSYLI
jgi:hypothetical protein